MKEEFVVMHIQRGYNGKDFSCMLLDTKWHTKWVYSKYLWINEYLFCFRKPKNWPQLLEICSSKCDA